MKELSFEWDENKSESNYRKHEVSFEEAKSVFWDENAKQFFDTDHSDDEDRFIMLGFSVKMRLLIVIHTFIKHKKTIRIISARKATRRESTFYGG